MKNRIILAAFILEAIAFSIAACGSDEEASYDVSNLEATTLTSQAIMEAKEEAKEAKEALSQPVTEAVTVHVPMDITGCDTFTQMVDKLGAGCAYANVKIGDTDVLLITEYTYDNNPGGEEQPVAIDADIYKYNEEGLPEYVGYVSAGGTAYPLAVSSDGILFTGANHYMKKYTMVDGELLVDEEASVEYQSDGSAKYYHSSETKEVEADENGQVESDSYMTDIYEEQEKADIIIFSVVQ